MNLSSVQMNSIHLNAGIIDVISAGFGCGTNRSPAGSLWLVAQLGRWHLLG
jgi:hypothetical protein